MARHVFRDRAEAGRALAGLLDHYRDRPDVTVLGLTRGGVPVADEVASALGAPLDAFVVRKLGLPEHPELAMGAIADGGLVVRNEDVLRAYEVSPEALREVTEREKRELHRQERAYRGGAPMTEVTGRTVILVDDGLATGASMRAAIQALRQLAPARVVVAVPAAPESASAELDSEVDEVVCATTPTPFLSVGNSYREFSPTSETQVTELLRAGMDRRAGGMR
jgi:predicted phosphoribosyltransferase